MRRSDQCTNGGFTLVELLVVVGIIAVLIEILLPVLRRARMASQRIACQSNVRQLCIGINLYCSDNHDWYPTCAAWADGAAYAQYADDWLYWQADRNIDDSPIAKYLKVHGEQLKTLLRCPADTFDGRKAFPGISAGQGPYLYSYGINSAVAINHYPAPIAPGRTKRTQWRRPSEKILFTEGLDQEPLSFAGATWSYAAKLTRRHGQAMSHNLGVPMGINVSAGFMDGHVQTTNEDFSHDNRQIWFDDQDPN